MNGFPALIVEHQCVKFGDRFLRYHAENGQRGRGYYYRCYPRVGEGICFHRLWFACLCVCLSVTTITKTIVDGFAPNFTGRFLGEKGRPSS